MAKIPFDIKYRPQIENGEYKIETKDHHPVRIICWNKNTGGLDRIVALVAGDSGQEKTLHYTEEGLCVATGSNRNKDLFIVTPEPEMSEFERAVGLEIFDEPFEERQIKVIKEESAKLLATARNEIVKSGYAIIEGEHYLEEGRKNYERGKADALKDLQENLANNDVYSVPEWLREVLLMAKENGKKEALKDLPRWKKTVQSFGNYTVAPTETGEYCLLIDGYFIMLSDLEKLPGFKEDEK